MKQREVLRHRIVQRLEAGPASMPELIRAGWPDGGEPGNARNSVSKTMHRLAAKGAPLAKRLSDRRYLLTGPLPADLRADLAVPDPEMLGRLLLNRLGDVSRETSVPNATLSAPELIERLQRRHQRRKSA